MHVMGGKGVGTGIGDDNDTARTARVTMMANQSAGPRQLIVPVNAERIVARMARPIPRYEYMQSCSRRH